VAPGAKTSGIEYRADGTINIIFDGVVRYLRAPKVKEIRHWDFRLRELANQTDGEAARLRELAARLPDASEEEQEQIQKEVDEGAARRREWVAPWLAEVVEGLSDKPLPDDVGDWPAWLAFDTSNPVKIINHWNTTPLVSTSKLPT
jgi:hypothetical protein